MSLSDCRIPIGFFRLQAIGKMIWSRAADGSSLFVCVQLSPDCHGVVLSGIDTSHTFPNWQASNLQADLNIRKRAARQPCFQPPVGFTARRGRPAASGRIWEDFKFWGTAKFHQVVAVAERIISPQPLAFVLKSPRVNWGVPRARQAGSWGGDFAIGKPAGEFARQQPQDEAADGGRQIRGGDFHRLVR